MIPFSVKYRPRIADELARFLVEEIRDDPRVPEGVRSMIGEHVREYCKRRKG